MKWTLGVHFTFGSYHVENCFVLRVLECMAFSVALLFFSIVLSSHWYNLSACTVVFNALYITEKGTKVIFCLTLLMHTTSSSNSEMLSWKIQPKGKKKQNHTATKKKPKENYYTVEDFYFILLFGFIFFPSFSIQIHLDVRH